MLSPAAMTKPDSDFMSLANKLRTEFSRVEKSTAMRPSAA